MKFTRLLPLALVAAAALSMTACDDSSSSDAASLSVISLSNIGTQKHSDPSFVSIRYGAVYKSGTGADQVQQNRDRVDIIVFADSNSAAKPSFYSPKRMTERFAGAAAATTFSGIATDTKFVNLGTDGEDVTFDNVKTTEDLKNLINDIDVTSFSGQNDAVGLEKNDVVAVQLVDGNYALVKVTEVAASGDYNIGVQLKYAK